MPEMDGYTASQEIRNTLKLNIPIIAMTAHVLAGEREKCLGFGMDEYISKPIREELLLQLINHFTENQIKAVTQKIQIHTPDTGSYKKINLAYMKEVSNGNVAYEKTVSEQFIEIIPTDLAALENAWKLHDKKKVRQLAHNMKTSVSVMGLDDILYPYLNEFEYEELTDITFQNNFTSLKFICEEAVEEVRHFYNQLPQQG